MARSTVAILRTSPATVLRDYHALLDLAGYQDVLRKDVDTALKINISWHFFFPGSWTMPWQLDGVARALLADGYSRDRLHACHDRTVAIDAHLGERENKPRCSPSGLLATAGTPPAAPCTSHRGAFAVMDGTFAGDGPGPRGIRPHVKNVMLASADRVAVEAVAARLMGFDRLSIKYIRLAHDAGLGCGDPREIRISGDTSAADERRHFVGPSRKMAFAARMQHQIYWGPLRRAVEWSLKTVLAPWAYLASVVYHDSFWYPLVAERQMKHVLASPWGRLFENGEHVTPDENGFPQVGDAAAAVTRTGKRAFVQSLGLLGTCLEEAPEFASRRRHQPPRAAA